jgi:hypothetical protein
MLWLSKLEAAITGLDDKFDKMQVLQTTSYTQPGLDSLRSVCGGHFPLADPISLSNMGLQSADQLEPSHPATYSDILANTLSSGPNPLPSCPSFAPKLSSRQKDGHANFGGQPGHTHSATNWALQSVQHMDTANLSSDAISADDAAGTESEPFEQHMTRKKRRRMLSRQDREETRGSRLNNNQSQSKIVASKPQTTKIARVPLMVGKGSSTTAGSRNITAAKSLQRKSVFCVDNVSTVCSVDDVRQFVSGMSVRVISCFEVKPRLSEWQRRANIIPSDRKTFRLCINKDDTDKLLDAEQ